MCQLDLARQLRGVEVSQVPTVPVCLVKDRHFRP
jgi:hypothetical protein